MKRFITSGIYKVDYAYVDPDKVAHILVTKRPRYRATLDLRLSLAEAMVCADLIALHDEANALTVMKALNPYNTSDHKKVTNDCF